MFLGAKSEGFLQDCAARYSPIFLAQHGSIYSLIYRLHIFSVLCKTRKKRVRKNI